MYLKESMFQYVLFSNFYRIFRILKFWGLYSGFNDFSDFNDFFEIFGFNENVGTRWSFLGQDCRFLRRVILC